MLDHKSATKLNKEELLNVVGGAVASTLTATMINAIAKGITTIVDLGRNLGSAIRRISSGKICNIN